MEGFDLKNKWDVQNDGHLCGRYGLEIRRNRDKRWKMEEENTCMNIRGWISSSPFFLPPPCDYNTKG
jgi:hypothetical protein